MRKVIDIKSLEFHYSRQKKLLDGLNLKLKSGSVHGLIGKNGEGKTTLLKLISGLLFPQKGEINVLGYNPQKRHPKMLGQIYFLPEELYQTNLSIEHFERIYAPFYPDFSSSCFYRFLNEFNIDMRSTSLSELSHGQKKKVMIAFGLATKAKLILMDEPTNGLDIPSKRQFRRMVSSAIDENTCIVISTHQVFDLENMVDNIIIMDEHKIIFNQQTANILEKLSFKTVDKRSPSDTVVYQEESTNGVGQIIENKSGQSEGVLDIELLFNALITDKDKINAILNQD